MRVLVFGFRGIPDVEGGIETHAENLYPLVSRSGYHIEILIRSAYCRTKKERTWEGVRIKSIWAPVYFNRRLEAVVHSFLCLFYSIIQQPDLLHLHGGAAALTAPLARLFGLRVIVTNHGPDYKSEKWSLLERWVIRIGESLAMRFSDGRIAVSKAIRDMIWANYRCTSVVIPNGVNIPRPSNSLRIIDQFGLITGKYVLCVSRFAPHKRHMDLINAFCQAKLDHWQLVLVGNCDTTDRYCRKIYSRAQSETNIILTGFQTGGDLNALFANAGLFVMPSSYEGLPIAVLEALSYGLIVLTSDIPAHLEIGLPASHYFPLGNCDALSKKLQTIESLKRNHDSRKQLEWVQKRYNWIDIAKKTASLYRHVLAAV